jgi:hypothetical protein
LTKETAQCTACKRLFESVEAFDLHRTGNYEGRRRCFDAREMEAAFTWRAGVWHRLQRKQRGKVQLRSVPLPIDAFSMDSGVLALSARGTCGER